jgi:hypothetical protein
MIASVCGAWAELKVEVGIGGTVPAGAVPGQMIAATSGAREPIGLTPAFWAIS